MYVASGYGRASAELILYLCELGDPPNDWNCSLPVQGWAQRSMSASCQSCISKISAYLWSLWLSHNAVSDKNILKCERVFMDFSQIWCSLQIALSTIPYYSASSHLEGKLLQAYLCSENFSLGEFGEQSSLGRLQWWCPLSMKLGISPNMQSPTLKERAMIYQSFARIVQKMLCIMLCAERQSWLKCNILQCFMIVLLLALR